NAAATSILPLLRPRMLDMCVATPSGLWGDVTSDGVVNIVDAQQVARQSVGLSVADPVAMAARADVTADAAANIVDAQQIARFSVALSSVPRTGTNAFVPPAPLSATMTPSAAQNIAIGATVQLTATPFSGAAGSGTDLTGCSSFTWGSSDNAIATVNASGFVT